MIEAGELLHIGRHLKGNAGLIRELSFGGVSPLNRTARFLGTHCPICFLSVLLLKVAVLPFVRIMDALEFWVFKDLPIAM